MRKLLLIAAATLGATLVAASPAQAQRVFVGVDGRVHVAHWDDDDDWRWRDRRRWRGDRWDRHDRRDWRRWQRHRERNWHRWSRRSFRPPPCRRVFWDGFRWRCAF